MEQSAEAEGTDPAACSRSVAGGRVVAAKVAERADEGVPDRAASALMEDAIGPLTDGGPAGVARAVTAARVLGSTTATRRLTGMEMGAIMAISGIDTG